MGVIQRQGIKNSLVNYSGILVGLISTLYIYPLDLESKGLIDFLLSLSVLFLPYAQLGVFAVYYKYFPSFSNQKAAFQTWVVKKLLVQFSIFVVIFFAIKTPLIQFLQAYEIDKTGNLSLYAYLVPFVIFLVLSQGFLTVISISNKRIVIPDLIQNIIQKLYFPLIILLKVTLSLSNGVFISMFFFYYFMTIPLLLWYNLKNNFIQFNLKTKLTLDKNKRKEIRTFNIFSLLNEISSQLSFKLDTVMVGSLIGLVSTGVYGIMFFMSNVMSSATKSILKISNPIISEKMSNNDLNGVSSIYKKSSITLFIFGLVVFFCIWFLMDDLLSLTKYSEQLKVGKFVFLYLGISQLFDMLTSVNSYIIIYSKFYRVNLLFVSVLGASNIFLNLTLIPIYGIEGAAIASLIALVGYNLMKLTFIYIKFRIHPFSLDTVKVLGIGAMSFLVLYFLPSGKFLANNYLNLGLKGIVIGVTVLLTFALPIYFLKISKEINGLANKLLAKITGRK